MQTEATALSTLARHREVKTCLKICRPGILERVRHFIESTDWDERVISQERCINRICLVVVVLSTLYLFPVLLSSLLK